VCATCGCGSADHDHRRLRDGGERAHAHLDGEGARTLRVERELLEKNARIADRNRRAAARDGLTILNLIGAPGAGKTSLLEAVLPRLGRTTPALVVEGDQATDRDARRIEAAGSRVVQINTGTGCHLDASMMERGIAALAPPRGSVIFVENVGNLVCPALFDLGERVKIVVMATTEGEDKPLKYPHVFRAARLLVLTKLDLLPHLDLDEARLVDYARDVAGPGLGVLRTSATSGEGIDALVEWIRAEARRPPREARGKASP
jgi:hydrogenase nickel incorporation protein HypB